MEIRCQFPPENKFFFGGVMYIMYTIDMGDEMQPIEGKQLHLLLPEDLLSAIDTFRFDFRFESRTAAIRHLIERGLDAKPAAKKTTKKGAGNGRL
jgi:hypothetical protein